MHDRVADYWGIPQIKQNLFFIVFCYNFEILDTPSPPAGNTNW